MGNAASRNDVSDRGERRQGSEHQAPSPSNTIHSSDEEGTDNQHSPSHTTQHATSEGKGTIVRPKTSDDAQAASDNQMESEQNHEESSDVDSEPGSMTIRILDLNGKYYRIDCRPEWTIATIKEKVAVEAEVAIPSQKLIYRGRVLEDDKSLDEYQVEDGHTIHLFVRMAPNPESEEASTEANNANTTSEDHTRMHIVHVASDVVSSAVFPSDSARRVDPLMLDSPLGNCARRVKLWSSFLLIIYTMKVMGQFALLANDQQPPQQNDMMDGENMTGDDGNGFEQKIYDRQRYDYQENFNQDPLIGTVELIVHFFGVYIGCVGFKAAHDTDIRPIRFYFRGILWLAVLTVAEQVYLTIHIAESDYPEERVHYPYGAQAPSKDDIVSANIFQIVMLSTMWVLCIHHSHQHVKEVRRYNESFAAAAMNAVPPSHLPDV